MTDRKGEQDLAASVRELAGALEGGLAHHPAPGELLDFLAGDLPEAEQERIEEHLALCRACARTALELASGSEEELASGEARLTKEEVAAEWERFRAALPPARPAWRRAAPGGGGWALAASLLLAVIGLAVWNVRLSRELRAPRAEVAVVDLVPLEAVERREETETVAIPGWADRVVLLLNFAEPTASTLFQIEILAEDGRPVWSSRGIRRSEEGTFSVEMPRSFLPAGVYRIRLSGIGETPEPVADYAVRIVPG